MLKKIVGFSLIALVLATGTSLLYAQQKVDFQAIQDSVPFDFQAVQSMTREERIAYQQDYKAALEAAAREQGWSPEAADRAFVPVDGAQAKAARVPGSSITYHSGALGVAGQNSFNIGNRFDTALTVGGTMLGPVEMSGSITMVTFDMISVSGGAAFISFFDQLVGTAANHITSINTAATTGLNVNTLGSPILYSGSSFLAGVWQFNTDVPAVATGTVAGQGHHGMSINDIVATQYVTLGSLNGAFAVGGDVATPVELLSFEITD